MLLTLYYNLSASLCIGADQSAFDTLTDLVCEYEQWKGGLVHRGMKVNCPAIAVPPANTFLLNRFSLPLSVFRSMVFPERGTTTDCVHEPACYVCTVHCRTQLGIFDSCYSDDHAARLY
jgi:hypothetical protein